MSSPQPADRPRLVLVREETSAAAGMKDTLRNWGYEVIATLTSLEDALELIAEVTPDLVITDMFPKGEIDGIAATEILWQKWDIPVVLLISEADIDKFKQAKPECHFGYTLQPFNEADLKTAVDHTLHFSQVDIKRRSIEKSLRESEKKFRDFAQLLPGVVCEADENGKIILVNYKAFDLFKYSEADLDQGLNVLQMLVPDDRDRAMINMTRLANGEDIGGIEYTALKNDGTTFPVIIFAGALFREGKFSGLRAFVLDLTDYRKAQDELQQTNDMLRATIEAAPVGIIGLDLEGRVHSIWNPAAERMLGWTAQEVMGHMLPSVPADSQEEYKGFREKIRQGENLDGVEVRRQKKDGTPIDYSIYASPLRDPAGEITGNVAVLLDITERKIAERNLKESEAKYIDFYENAPDMYVSVNAKTALIEKCNTTLTNALCYYKDEIIGKPVFEIYHPDCLEDAKKAFREFVKTGEVHDKELQLRRQDGSKLDVSLNASAVRADDGEILLSRSILRDITERKRNSIINAARLHLIQFSVEHSLDELLEETLNEAEKLTDSLIGFYHFVEDDQKHLILKNWSTRTKGNFCTAEKGPRHYAISEAGVWVDCVYQRQPVIHNDYASLPHRKGMPKGHAEVIRELVVPVFRGEKIKAILGVGNKPGDYTEKDVEAVSLLANLAWEIAERKRVDDALRESEERYRIVADNTYDWEFWVSHSGRFLYNSPSCLRVTGYHADEFIHEPDLLNQIIHPEDRHLFQLHWQEIEKEKTIHEINFRILLPDGSIRHIGHACQPVFDAKGQYWGRRGSNRDITASKQAEEALRESEELFRALVDQAGEGIFLHDGGKILDVNNAACELLGYSREELLHLSIEDVDIRVEQDRYVEKFWEILAPGKTFTFDSELRRKDGTLCPVEISLGRVEFRGRKLMLGLARDISERNQREQERLSNLKFFESMDKINRAIQGANDLEGMMSDVLDIVLEVFDCDRTYLLYPCDPEAASWQVPMERCRPEYPGIKSLGLEIPMDASVAASIRTLLDADGPVKFGPGTEHPLPEEACERFGFKCFMAMALYPKVGKPWQFGIHQCSHLRTWTQEEERLFREIGRRVSDALTGLLTNRDLQESERFLNNIVENIPNMIFVKDAQALRFVRFNKAGEQLMGYTREEMIGKTDHDLLPKEVADFFTAKDRQVLDSKELVDIPEETIKTRLKGERILHTTKIPILDEIEKPQYLLGISEDITERKQAEESVRKLSLAIEQSPVSIIITDTSGSIEFVNRKFTQITGYSYDEVLGKNPRILKSGETSTEEYQRLWRTVSSGGVWSGEFHNRKKNGELFWEQATIAPIRNADNVITHYVSVKEDITEKVLLESQLRQSQKMESVGRLAGGVAHDFNNMLGVIIGHAELCMSQVDPSQPFFASLLEIRKAALRSSDLTRQLLAFARKQTVVAKVIDLNATVEGMLKMLRRLVGENIDLVWLPEKSLWPVKMDPTQIDQILANLCVNASDAITGVGKISIETQAVTLDEAYTGKHHGCPPGDYVMLAVSDDGHGIDKETLEKIFEPFFTTKELGKGTGLGLATVYGIVRQNDGFINVYSEPGHGTTFKIYFPRHKAEIGQIRQESLVIQHARDHETILLVEDDPSILETVRLLLDNLEYRVLTAMTPREAVHLAKEYSEKIDLLLTDVVMPEMNGLELSKILTTIKPDLKCLFMSGYTADIISQHGVLPEGIKYLQKPITLQGLAAKLREVLDNK